MSEEPISNPALDLVFAQLYGEQMMHATFGCRPAVIVWVPAGTQTFQVTRVVREGQLPGIPFPGGDQSHPVPLVEVLTETVQLIDWPTPFGQIRFGLGSKTHSLVLAQPTGEIDLEAWHVRV